MCSGPSSIAALASHILFSPVLQSKARRNALFEKGAPREYTSQFYLRNSGTRNFFKNLEGIRCISLFVYPLLHSHSANLSTFKTCQKPFLNFPAKFFICNVISSVLDFANFIGIRREKVKYQFKNKSKKKIKSFEFENDALAV